MKHPRRTSKPPSPVRQKLFPLNNSPRTKRERSMLELLLCSSLTLFPDFLYRRYVQGKRLGHEITLFSVWYELRWGITPCLILTVLLITVVLYHHPATHNVTSLFRA